MKILKNIRGAVFITVILISALMVLIGVSMSNLILQDAHMIRHLKESTQAQYLAEAGVGRALVGLATATSFDAYAPPAGDVTLDPGTYTISVAHPTVGEVERWLITATGTAGSTTRTVTMEVKEIASEALQYALAAGTNIKLTANNGSITVKGDIHANNFLTLHGQNSPVDVEPYATLAGNATCSSTKSQAYKEIGTVTFTNPAAVSGGGYPRLNMPSFDFGAFKTMAETGGLIGGAAKIGKFYSGDQTFTDTDNIDGGAANTAGITYVDGDVTFLGTPASPCTITGGFVAKGNITLNNGNALTQVAHASDYYPIFMSREGSRIKLYGNFTSTDGNIVYATNDVQIETPGGGSTILGTVIAGGSFTITANDNLELTYKNITTGNVQPIAIDIVSWNR
jgi:hypothetical protein